MILLSYEEMNEMKKVHPQIRKVCAARVREVAFNTDYAPTYKNATLTFTSLVAVKRSLASSMWLENCRERYGN